MSLAFTLLWRQWRSRNLRLMFISLVLAMATLLSLHLLTARIEHSVARSAKELLAADVRIESSKPITAAVEAELQLASLRISRVVEFQSMVYAATSDPDAAAEGHIAQVKAVEAGYPFYGQVVDEQRQPLLGQPGPGEAWLNLKLAERLNLKPGDRIDIGEAQFRISALFAAEPDNPQGAFALSARALIAYGEVARTQSISPGARVSYAQLVMLKPDAQQALEAALKPHLDAHTRLVTLTNYRSNSQDFIQRINSFLMLAGALGVLLAGVALAIAAQEYTAGLAQPFALLKTFGMRPKAVLRVFVIFALSFFALATLMAQIVGLLSHFALMTLLKDYLASTQLALLKPMAASAFAGLILLVAFLSVPVAQLWRFAPAATLREQKLKTKSAWLPGFLAVFAVMGVLSGAWQLTGYLLLGSSLLVLLVALGAERIINPLSRAGQLMPGMWRAGFLALKRHRRSNRYLLAVFALLLVPIIVMAQLRSRLIDTWQMQLPAKAPNYFLFNVYSHDKQALEPWLKEQQFAAAPFYPMWRARITAINLRPLAEVVPSEANNPSVTREINLTSSALLPAGNELKAGQWWAAEQPKLLISVEERIAQTLQLKLNDRVSLSLAGETVEAEVASIRSVRWDNLAPNFYLITNKPPQSELTANWITSLHVPETKRSILLAQLKQFPNITAIDVAQTLSTMRQLIHKLSQAVEVVWVFMALAGVLVLLASVQASLPARRQEIALLRVAGASKRYAIAGLVGEFFILGLVASVAALMVSEGLLYWLQVKLFKLEYASVLWPWLLVPLLGSSLIALLGGWYCRQLITVPPATILREQSR